jgi:hypothetical protein
MMLDKPIDPAPARPSAQAGAQLGQVRFVSVGYDLNVAVLCVPHPPAQVQLAGLAVYKPAEADALHTTLNQKMKNHGY